MARTKTKVKAKKARRTRTAAKKVVKAKKAKKAKKNIALGKISSDVPYDRRGRKSAFTEKLGEMQTGDSFIIDAKVISLYRSSASLYGKRNNKQFSILREGSKHRCHRIG